MNKATEIAQSLRRAEAVFRDNKTYTGNPIFDFAVPRNDPDFKVLDYLALQFILNPNTDTCAYTFARKHKLTFNDVLNNLTEKYFWIVNGQLRTSLISNGSI